MADPVSKVSLLGFVVTPIYLISCLYLKRQRGCLLIYLKTTLWILNATNDHNMIIGANILQNITAGTNIICPCCNVL